MLISKILIGALVFYSAISSAEIFCNKGETFWRDVRIANDPRCTSNMALIVPKFGAQLLCATPVNMKVEPGSYNICLKFGAPDGGFALMAVEATTEN